MRYPIVELDEVVVFLDHRRRPITANARVAGNVPYYGANGQQDSVDGFLFDEPLVLLAEDGGHFGDPEKGVAYSIEGKSWVNNHAHVLRPTEKIDLGFLTRVLENRNLQPFISGSTRGKLTKASASKIPIPLPPLPEQRRIAAILDQADELGTKRRHALALLDELADSNFASLEAEIESSSEQVRIRDVADIQTGPFGSLLHKEDYELGSVPIVNPTHIVDGEIVPDPKLTVSVEKCEELAVFRLRAGDVILGRRGEMGRAAVVRESSLPLLCGTGSMILRPRGERIYGEVLATTIRSPRVRKSLEDAALGVTMLNLNQRIVGDLFIALPSLESQKVFANSSHRLRLHREVLLAQITVLDELFASLQHRAFQGEL